MKFKKDIIATRKFKNARFFVIWGTCKIWYREKNIWRRGIGIGSGANVFDRQANTITYGYNIRTCVWSLVCEGWFITSEMMGCATVRIPRMEGSLSSQTEGAKWEVLALITDWEDLSYLCQQLSAEWPSFLHIWHMILGKLE